MSMRLSRVAAMAARYRFAAIIIAGVMVAFAGVAGGPGAVAAPPPGRQPAGAGGSLAGMTVLHHFRGAGGGPIAVNPSTGSLYEAGGAGLSVLDGQTGQATAGIALADQPASIG